MNLDAATLYRAVESRDRRFEGRFVLGVLTTGIYCRPGCPARLPRPENVRFFACHAAAESTGFRPCRRCRPEATPGTPASLGTGATVARARLLAIPGIGPWTVEYIALRAFGEPDAFPASDLALRRALHDKRAGGEAPGERAVGKLAEPFRPFRAYAAMHLWTSLKGP